MEDLKRCKKCNEWKAVAHFPFDKASQYYSSPCKACRAEKMKAFRQKHAERLRESERRRSAARLSEGGSIRQWLLANPDKVAAANAQRSAKDAARRAARLAATGPTPNPSPSHPATT